MATVELPWAQGSTGSVSVTYNATQGSGVQEVSVSTSDNTALVTRDMTVVLTTGVSSPSGRSAWSPASATITVSQDEGRGAFIRTYYKIEFSRVGYSSEGATGPFTDL